MTKLPLIAALTLSLASVFSAPLAQAKPQRCNDCAKVTSVRVVEKQGQGSGLGVIGGGVAGALLGNQVGSGHGRELATLAGAAGGAYAGNRVEKNMRTTREWNVAVQYENGNRRTFAFAQDPHLARGQSVRNRGNSIVRR